MQGVATPSPTSAHLNCYLSRPTRPSRFASPRHLPTADMHPTCAPCLRKAAYIDIYLRPYPSLPPKAYHYLGTQTQCLNTKHFLLQLLPAPLQSRWDTGTPNCWRVVLCHRCRCDRCGFLSGASPRLWVERCGP